MWGESGGPSKRKFTVNLQYAMLQRITAALLLFIAVAAYAASPAPPKAIAPPAVPHPVAMFLANLCGSGKKKVTFKAAAAKNRFYFEEAAGVTVYIYDGTGYRKETFIRAVTLATAMKRYGDKL